MSTFAAHKLNHMKKTAFFSLAALVFFACASPQPKTTDDEIIEEEDSTEAAAPHAASEGEGATAINLLEIIDNRPELSIFRELLAKSYVEGAVGNEVVYTVVAPTNDAFNMLPKGKLDELRSEKGMRNLRMVVGNHVFQGSSTTADIDEAMSAAGALRRQAMSGKYLLLKNEGRGYTVEGVAMNTTDLQGTNGTLHIIDKVIL
jgi:uncharacterized surface protein with fasciclin (FAS1) repeats